MRNLPAIATPANVQRVTLDDLYREARRLGDVEIGALGEPNHVRIKVALGPDYCYIHSGEHDLKTNLHVAIFRCRRLIGSPP